MDMDRALIVVCITVLVVIALNVGIYLSMRRGDEVTTISMLRNAARRARDPWQDEDEALKELSHLVSGFKERSPGRNQPDEEQNDQQD